MAVNAVAGIVCLSMNEQVSDLVQRLDALNPCAITELVLRNCLLGEPAELCAQISRCVRLRRLSCAACALPPSTLLNLMLERLQYLQQLELSLIQDPDALVDFEIESMRTIAMQMREVIPVPQPASPLRRGRRRPQLRAPLGASGVVPKPNRTSRSRRAWNVLERSGAV
ncbi:hypothetical protein MTO96_042831 [Rhipicephalus appendiculatus]